MDDGQFLGQCNAMFPNLELGCDGDPPRGDIANRLVNDVQAIHIESSPVLGRASHTRARGGDLSGHCKIVWQLRGGSIYRGDRDTIAVSAGQAIIVPLGASYALEVLPDYRAAMLIAPARYLWPAGPACRHPVLLANNPAMDAAGSVVACLLRCVGDSVHPPLLVRTALDLVYGAFAASSRTLQDAFGRATRRARQHIRAHLADSYTPSDLARDMGMSRRSLYAALAAEDQTPAKLIRQVRLEQAHQSVLDHGQSNLSLAEIAHRHGLGDGAALSRAFRSVYGTTPSAMRRARLGALS
ncbi:AraC family transcriptional regulator [Caulobacter sp. SSI4214]|uniref:AraC family transcriptional regulator n=1 Tax=Caulobacter sp. SSI4214 TaxID=2575739 RepID=UPI00143AEE42|nr:AraC family transcriptional regulator [Caulobacter sp. SSI4214]